MKQKTRYKNFGNNQYRLLVHEWPLYRYRPYRSNSGLKYKKTFIKYKKKAKIQKKAFDTEICGCPHVTYNIKCGGRAGVY